MASIKNRLAALEQVTMAKVGCDNCPEWPAYRVDIGDGLPELEPCSHCGHIPYQEIVDICGKEAQG